MVESRPPQLSDMFFVFSVPYLNFLEKSSLPRWLLSKHKLEEGPPVWPPKYTRSTRTAEEKNIFQRIQKEIMSKKHTREVTVLILVHVLLSTTLLSFFLSMSLTHTHKERDRESIVNWRKQIKCFISSYIYLLKFPEKITKSFPIPKLHTHPFQDSPTMIIIHLTYNIFPSPWTVSVT